MTRRDLSLSALHVLNDGYAAALPLLLPFAQSELGLSLSQVGVLASVLGFSSMVLAVPAGAAAARFGGTRILLGAMAAYGAAFAIAGAAPGFPALLAAFLPAGIAFGVFHPIAFSVVARAAKGDGLGRKLGGFAAVGDFGRIGFAAALTFLVARVGWRGTAWAGSAAAFALLAALAFALRGDLRPEPPEKAAVPGGTGKGTARALLRDRDFLLASVVGLLDSLAGTTLFVFLPFLLVKRGADPSLLGSFAGAFFVGNLLGKSLLGRLVDRIGNLRTFAFSELAMAAVLVAVGTLPSVGAIVGLSILLGILSKGTVPVVGAFVAEASGKHDAYEKAFGINGTITGMAAAAAPAAYGLVADAAGVEVVFYCCAAFACAAVLPSLFIGRGRAA